MAGSKRAIGFCFRFTTGLSSCNFYDYFSFPALLVSFSICIVLLIVFLCALLIYKKKKGHQRQRIEDEADQPLLEDGDGVDDEYSKHVRQLTASELKTADQIRRKYKKAKQVTSSGESQDEGSGDTSKKSRPPGMGLSSTILDAAKKFQKDSSSDYNNKDDEYHFNKGQPQIGATQHTPASAQIPVPIKDEKHDEKGGEDQIDPSASPQPPSYQQQHPASLNPLYHEDNSDVGSTTSSRTSSRAQSSVASNHPDDNVMTADSSFSGDASIYLSINYLESTDCIIGNIKKLKNVNMNAKNCPKDISFHLKLLPRGKFRMKTPWRVCGTNDLSLTFTIGPVKTRQIIDSSLCIRLYGRMSKNRFARAKCYGECMIKLNQLFGIEGNLKLVKKLVSKSHHKSADDFRFTTDDESEFA